MKKLLFLILIIANYYCLSAQNTDSLFVAANKLYKEQKFEQAISLYKKIEAQNVTSSELYYNLGNAYYKLNKVAPTIYNYEKALLLNPLNKDASNNLIFAKRLTLDKIDALPKSVWQKFQENFLQKLSYNQWAIVGVLFSILTAILVLLFYFANASSKKRLYFISSIFTFFILIVSISISYHQYHVSKSTIQAIIFAEKIEVKNAPTLNSEDVFTLHEGTKVFVLDTVDDWKKIKLADGKIGWTPSNNLKILTLF